MPLLIKLGIEMQSSFVDPNLMISHEEKLNILLVDPHTNYPNHKNRKHSYKSGHRKNIPISLLKLAGYHRSLKNNIQLVSGCEDKEEIEFIPDQILITSIFTYWAQDVKDAVSHYRDLFPNAYIIVGGIYASLMPEHCKEFTKCDEVFVGTHAGAETSEPAYDLIDDPDDPLEHQIIHVTRGCTKTCKFCGVYRVETKFITKKNIIDEIICKKVLFYDNNLLASPQIDNIMNQLIELKESNMIEWCEAQCGLDKFYLLDKPHLAKKLKEAGFRHVKLAFDNDYDTEKEPLKKAVQLLLDAGFTHRDLSVFMVYNYKYPYEIMEMKRKLCFELKLQVMDCRFRPLDQIIDKYNPQSNKKSKNNYFINKEYGWTDAKIRKFRKHVRRQNIVLRHNLPFYSPVFVYPHYLDIRKEVNNTNEESEKIRLLREVDIEYWYPLH